MRVIGGELRGRRLAAPRIEGLRPTSDRVREAIFDILESRFLLDGASLFDLFAGSGALGIEALSRGAAEVTFVDSDRRAVAAIEENVERLGLDLRIGPDSRPGPDPQFGPDCRPGPGPDADAKPGVARVVQADVIGFLRRPGTGVIDLALVDPPYSFDLWPELLSVLRARVAVLEHSSPLPRESLYEVVRCYRYGSTLVTLVTAGTATAGRG